MPIRLSKSAHPTYEKCPFDLRNMPIRPTKNAHLTYKKAHQTTTNVSLSDSLKYGRMHHYAVFYVTIRPTVHRTYHSC